MDGKPNEDRRRPVLDAVLEFDFVPQWVRQPPGKSPHSKETTPAQPAEPGPREQTKKNPSVRRRGHPDRAILPPEKQKAVRKLPLNINFLPEQKHLASLVRQIRHNKRAYPLMDLANLLMREKNGCLVKIEVRGEREKVHLFQCSECKALVSSEERIIEHLKQRHLENFFEKETNETQLPSGNFSGVARCQRTGTLIGPSNHHSYADQLAKWHQSYFAHLPLEECKRYIEIVRDKETIEEWRQAFSTQVRYRPKGQPEAQAMSCRQAEAAFSRQIPALFTKVHRVILPVATAQCLDDRDLLPAIQSALAKERPFPLSLALAMRTAFRHMNLYLFKEGRINFVIHAKPCAIRAKDTVDAIAQVLQVLEQHPRSTRQQLVEEMHPGLDPASEEARKVLQPLGWLIERGHIIEFFNGMLSLPSERKE